MLFVAIKDVPETIWQVLMIQKYDQQFAIILWLIRSVANDNKVMIAYCQDYSCYI